MLQQTLGGHGPAHVQVFLCLTLLTCTSAVAMGCCVNSRVGQGLHSELAGQERGLTCRLRCLLSNFLWYSQQATAPSGQKTPWGVFFLNAVIFF